MQLNEISKEFFVAGQISKADIAQLTEKGIKTVICNRPDEEEGAVSHKELAAAAKKAGLKFHYLPVISGAMSQDNVIQMAGLLDGADYPVLAYCRTGRRSATLFEATKSQQQAESTASGGHAPQIVIVGSGAAGIAVASSLLERNASVQITLIDPADVHCYQPGWTMVGAGVFTAEDTIRTMASQIPAGVNWVKKAVSSFSPDKSQITLDDGMTLSYDQLIVCPGLKLNWGAVKGLEDTLGKNGVTSNYRADLAPYTWELVQSLKSGKALFTQPPMPIKCAGAPQKALYLSSDHWLRSGCLDQIDVEFCNAGGVLFGVKDYVPALMEYVEKYNATLSFNMNLVAIDGPKKTATFAYTDDKGKSKQVKKTFDMIHVCPPQTAPDFISASPLADDAGWVDVDPATLQHKRYANIWGLGDATNSPNAKTAAAVRKQAPVVAENLLSYLLEKKTVATYKGYGSCPLTVERGRIVLAEFGYGGQLQPSFPKWLINGQRPTRLAWFLKEKILPWLYWNGMLKGKEWLAKPSR